MNTRSRLALLTSVVFSTLLAAPVLAQDNSMAVEPEASRSMDDMAAEAPETGRSMPAMERSGSARAPQLDPDATRDAYTVIKRSRDGSESTMEPGEAVMRAIMGETEVEDERGTTPPEDTSDPDFSEAETDRSIVGADERVQITNSAAYPFSAVGLVLAVDAAEDLWNCTGTVIGPRLVLTAARCVYNHASENPWHEQYTFWPGIGGEDYVPYEGLSYENVYVFAGFVEEFDGTYDSIWPYDLALIELETEVQNQTGSLGHWYYDNLGDFDANLVGYHEDTELLTMWRSECEIRAEQVTALDIVHDCDASGALGAPLYLYDTNVRGRYVVALQMGSENEGSWALRVHPAAMEWIAEINQ